MSDRPPAPARPASRPYGPSRLVQQILSGFSREYSPTRTGTAAQAGDVPPFPGDKMFTRKKQACGPGWQSGLHLASGGQRTTCAFTTKQKRNWPSRFPQNFPRSTGGLEGRPAVAC